MSYLGQQQFGHWLYCNRQSSAPTNFCRWCGVEKNPGSTVPENLNRHDCKTVLLHDHLKGPGTLSRRSLDTVKQNVAVKTGPLHLNRFGVLMLAVVIAIPMWLLIILLSPLDAYMAARAASSQMSIQ